MPKPKLGRPFTYDADKHLQPLTQAVREVLALGQVAGICGVPRITFRDWLVKGDEDLKNGINSDFAQLSTEIRRAQGERARELIAEGLKGKKNCKFVQWLLRVCLKEDFGDSNEELQKLLESFIRLRDHVERDKKAEVNEGNTQGEIPVRKRQCKAN